MAQVAWSPGTTLLAFVKAAAVVQVRHRGRAWIRTFQMEETGVTMTTGRKHLQDSDRRVGGHQCCPHASSLSELAVLQPWALDLGAEGQQWLHLLLAALVTLGWALLTAFLACFGSNRIAVLPAFSHYNPGYAELRRPP